MPELATTKSAGLPSLVFQPINPSSYFRNDLSPAPAIDTSKMSAAAANSSVYGAMAQALAGLPGQITKAYQDGRKMRMQKSVEADYEAAKKSGDPSALSNFRVSGDGQVSFNPADPLDKKIRELQLAKLSEPSVYDKILQNQQAKKTAVAPSLPAKADGPIADFGKTADIPIPAAGAISDFPALPSGGGDAPATDAPASGLMGGTGLESVAPTPVPTAAPAGDAAQPMHDPNAQPPDPSQVSDPDPVTGIMRYTDPSGVAWHIGPAMKNWEQSTATKATTPAKGMKFASAADAMAAGYDPTGAAVNPDGSLTVATFKASGTDAKGRGKNTDNQRNALASASVLSKSIDNLMTDYDKLSAENKVGPIMGRIETGKRALGMGSEEGSKIASEMNVSLFKIARMLNGAGVLTDKDIKRAEDVAPTLNMNREQFKGQLDAVKSTIKESLDTWKQINAGQATEEQLALADEAIASLSGTSASEQAAAPAAAHTAPVTASTRDNPAAVNSPEEYKALPVGAWYKDSAGNIAQKKK